MNEKEAKQKVTPINFDDSEKQNKILKMQKKQIQEKEEFYEMLDEIQDDSLYQMLKKLK